MTYRPPLRISIVAVHGQPFIDLTDAQQDALLRDIEQGQVRVAWADVQPNRFIDALVTIATETFYATDDSPARAMIGYSTAATRAPGIPIEHTTLTTVRREVGGIVAAPT